MRKVINGKVYNTETADKICPVTCYWEQGNFKWHATSLYRTKKGAWFIAGKGNAASMWAQYNGNTYSDGRGLTVITEDEAREIVEEANLDVEDYSKLFAVEDA